MFKVLPDSSTTLTKLRETQPLTWFLRQSTSGLKAKAPKANQELPGGLISLDRLNSEILHSVLDDYVKSSETIMDSYKSIPLTITAPFGEKIIILENSSRNLLHSISDLICLQASNNGMNDLLNILKFNIIESISALKEHAPRRLTSFIKNYIQQTQDAFTQERLNQDAKFTEVLKAR